MKKIAFTVFTISWMVVIFLFSAKPAPQSADMSMSVGKLMGRTFINEFATWDENEQTAFAEKIDYPVRKIAHGMEYAVLGILLMLMFRSYGLRGKCWIGTSFVVGVVYACTDEIHQLFVPGRGGRFSDVLIDSAGVLGGIVLVLLILFLFHRKSLTFPAKHNKIF